MQRLQPNCHSLFEAVAAIHVWSDAGWHGNPDIRVAYIVDPVDRHAANAKPVGVYTWLAGSTFMSGGTRSTWPDWARPLPDWAAERLKTWARDYRRAALPRAEATIRDYVRGRRRRGSSTGYESAAFAAIDGLPPLTEATLPKWRAAVREMRGPKYGVRLRDVADEALRGIGP